MSIDNPANHILIKSVDQFVAMLTRRGYNGEQTGKDECRAWCGSEEYHFGSFLYHSVAEVAEWFDRWMAAGQHHVCCAQCQEPLLQKEVAMIGIPELVFEPDYKPEPKQYRYRSAKSGPGSLVLSACPGCGVLLDSNTKEIKDE